MKTLTPTLEHRYTDNDFMSDRLDQWTESDWIDHMFGKFVCRICVRCICHSGYMFLSLESHDKKHTLEHTNTHRYDRSLRGQCCAQYTHRQLMHYSMQCGFSGNEGSVTCPTDSDSGAAPIVSISCDENSCQAVSLPDTLVTDSTASVPCENGLVLNTQSQNSCSVNCAPGYRGEVLSIALKRHQTMIR